MASPRRTSTPARDTARRAVYTWSLDINIHVRSFPFKQPRNTHPARSMSDPCAVRSKRIVRDCVLKPLERNIYDGKSTRRQISVHCMAALVSNSRPFSSQMLVRTLSPDSMRALSGGYFVVELWPLQGVHKGQLGRQPALDHALLAARVNTPSNTPSKNPPRLDARHSAGLRSPRHRSA